MPYITICRSKTCPKKDHCYRSRATPSILQSYSDFSSMCNQHNFLYFWGIERKSENLMKPQFHGNFDTTYCGAKLLYIQYIVFANLYIVVMEQLGTCLATTQLLRLKYRINYICSQYNKSIWLIQVDFIPYIIGFQNYPKTGYKPALFQRYVSLQDSKTSNYISYEFIECELKID